MSSITYRGYNLGRYVSAEVVEPAAHKMKARTAEILGRPGALLLDTNLEPLVLRVRLMGDAGAGLGIRERSEIRRALRSILACPEGGDLVICGEPELTWKDAVCTDSSGWSELFDGGWATIEFTCYDPIAYGRKRSSTDEIVKVGGSWPVLPYMELTCKGITDVEVTDIKTGKFVHMNTTVEAGSIITLDFEHEKATFNGEEASSDIALESEFFPIGPEDTELMFMGCSRHVVSWQERWA